jgi:hypothetical protein
MAEASQCGASKLDGSPCRAKPLPGSVFCLFHDPARAVERDAARQAGGKARSKPAAVLPPEAGDLPLRTAGDAAEALAVVANEVRKGQLDPKVGNAVGYLISVQLRALEDPLLREVEELRREVEAMRHGPSATTAGAGPAAGGGAGPAGAGQPAAAGAAGGPGDDLHARGPGPGPVAGEPLALEFQEDVAALLPPGG